MSLAKWLAKAGEDGAAIARKLKGGAADALIGREVAGPGNMLRGHAAQGIEDELKQRTSPGREAFMDFAQEHPGEAARQQLGHLAGAGGMGLAGYELGKDEDEDKPGHKLDSFLKRLGLE